MKKTTLIIILLALCQPVAITQVTQKQNTENLSDRVDKLFNPWNRPTSPGCALSVIKDGNIVYERGYGMADLEHNVPISPTTVFDIASMSKQFTGMAIMLLAQQGKLSLDDDVRKYIPEVPDYGKPIKLRHLLYHTSGLRNHFQLYQLSGWRWGDLETRLDDLAFVSRQKELNFQPGDEHSYTNTGYILLGEVVRRISGQSLRQFAAENIFKPLGMESTQIYDDVSLIIKNRAWGYGGAADGNLVNNITRFEDSGASNVYTSVADLARWDRNFYEKKVGGEGGVAQLLQPGTLNNGRILNYAAGLRLGEYKGLRLVWHAGSSASRSEYLRFPDQKFSVICLCNAGAIDPSELARQVADIYLADLLKPEVRQTPPAPETQAKEIAQIQTFINEHAVKIPEPRLAALAGIYVNTDNGNYRTLLFKDGKLMFARRPGELIELAPIGVDRFMLAGVPSKLEISFKEPWPGYRLMLVSSGPDLTPLVLVYAGAEAKVNTQLAEYSGTFQSDEADAVVNLVTKNGQLVLRTRKSEEPEGPPGSGAARGWYPLESIGGDSFKNEWIGMLRFICDDRNQIVGFFVANFAGGVRHLNFRKLPATAR